MRILLSWLSEWVEVPWPAKELGERLTMAGMEVEGVQELEVLGEPDAVLDVKVTSNRGDVLSVRGVAREVAAIAGARLRPPGFGAAPSKETPAVAAASVEIKAPDLCPRYSAQVIEGVKIGPAPELVQARLEAVGVRPINSIVDATNYVMFEMGQPLHAFDLRLLAGAKIIVRRSGAGEVMVTLDGVERRLTGDELVIADEERAVALAGIMGGENTEVRPDTERVLIESAHFTPATVMRTSRRLGIASESSYRFERWVDPSGTVEAMQRAAALMCEWSGARSLQGMLDLWPGETEKRVVEFSPERIRRHLGVEVTDKEQRGILESLGLRVEEGDTWRAEVPHHRNDLSIWHDLAEEVARIYGYNRIPLTLPRGEVQAAGYSEEAEFTERVRDAFLACGLTEIVTFSLVSPECANRGQWGGEGEALVEARNPRSVEYSALRGSMLGTMLEVAAHNFQRESRDLYLFEVGKVYAQVGGAMKEGRRGAVLIAGQNWGASWNLSETGADFYQLKGIVETVLRGLQMAERVYSSESHPGLDAKRTAVALVDGVAVARLGAVAEEAKRPYDLEGDLWFAEIDLDAVAGLEKRRPAYSGVPVYPAVLWDLSVVAPVAVSYAQLEGQIREAGGELLESVEVFDVYVGEQVPKGCRAVAVRLRFRSEARTLTDGEVEPVIGGIVASLESLDGVRVRRSE